MKSVGVRTVETIMLVLVMLIAVFASCHKSATSSSSSASKSISPFITIDGGPSELKDQREPMVSGPQKWIISHASI
jgi:hypothetical protein